MSKKGEKGKNLFNTRQCKNRKGRSRGVKFYAKVIVRIRVTKERIEEYRKTIIYSIGYVEITGIKPEEEYHKVISEN